MTTNPLLHCDTFKVITYWIGRYDNKHDTIISKVCLSNMCQFFVNHIQLSGETKETFLRSLLRSNTYNPNIFKQFFASTYTHAATIVNYVS